MVGLEGQHRGLASALTFKDSSTKCLGECNGDIIGSLEVDLKETLLGPSNSPGSSVSVDVTKSAHRGVDLHSKSPSFWDGMSCKCQRLAQITKLYSSFFLRGRGRGTLGYRAYFSGGLSALDAWEPVLPPLPSLGALKPIP